MVSPSLPLLLLHTASLLPSRKTLSPLSARVFLFYHCLSDLEAQAFPSTGWLSLLMASDPTSAMSYITRGIFFQDGIARPRRRRVVWEDGHFIHNVYNNHNDNNNHTRDKQVSWWREISTSEGREEGF
jgi:hypothetical protein